MALTMVKPDEMESQVGTKLPPGEWFEVDQERINTFADCTEDHQFIHIDEAAAAQTPFGGTIAHGFLTLSLMTKLCAENGVYPEGIVMGRQLRFGQSPLSQSGACRQARACLLRNPFCGSKGCESLFGEAGGHGRD